MPKVANGVLQTATVISKTIQTDIGSAIACAGYTRITLFFSYVKGDETGLDVEVHFLRTSGGTEHQELIWTASAGVKTAAAVKHRVTASGDYHVTIDIEGVELVKFTQGGSNNDGTPTGTLAASYTLKG